MNLNLQYITDGKGHKNAVQLPMEEWEKIEKDLQELERLRNKKLFLSELAEAVAEMKLIKEGKLQARDAQKLIDEL
jgi:PHD/YefM family antitoxin component YafN of YafNO toxin-antitoxin module